MLQPFYDKNRDLLINVNGELLHRDEARISVFDSTVQNGDGVWEGLRVYDGRIFKLTEHLDRLRHSALALAYVDIPSHAQITEQIKRTLEANDMRDNVHIRLTLSRGIKYTSGLDPRVNTHGHSLIIIAEHKPPVYDKSGLRFITSTFRRPGADVLDQKIHSCNQLTSILAKIQANAAGVDDALMLDQRGFLAETNATHVFLVEGEPEDSLEDCMVVTSTTAACPEGITRATVLQLCHDHGIAHMERDITLAELYRARELFCTGTMGELAPVIELDGRAIGDGSGGGAMTAKLSGLYGELTKREGVQVVD